MTAKGSGEKEEGKGPGGKAPKLADGCTMTNSAWKILKIAVDQWFTSLGAVGRGTGVLFGFLDGPFAADCNQHCRHLLRRGRGEGEPDQPIPVAAGRDRH